MDKETKSKYKINGNYLSISAILSIMAGIIMIVGGISTIFMFGWYQSMFGGMYWMPGMTHQGTGSWPPSMAMPSGNMLGALISLSLLSVGPGIASFIAGYKMYKEPENSQNWALLVLTASIVGFFGMGLFGIGAVLGVIGGVMGMVPKRR